MLTLKLGAVAEQEQMRADDLARKIFEIMGDPDHQMRGCLDWYQLAYRLASEAAAARTVQPRRWRRWAR
ncbi:hypothetical protein [Streptacidiphilus melanogenes]|uniref:hypothetical protein n=1 Tax=Streptacidiphilus melanogenes TaxID=411235 RepID=UPI001269901D|nr:hypothetical protein [Streptacidiphilus melanogenes]